VQEKDWIFASDEQLHRVHVSTIDFGVVGIGGSEAERLNIPEANAVVKVRVAWQELLHCIEVRKLEPQVSLFGLKIKRDIRFWRLEVVERQKNIYIQLRTRAN
jgi:hypothetical protein